jgi:hypothetical protein
LTKGGIARAAQALAPRVAESYLKQEEFIHSTFISFSSNQTGCFFSRGPRLYGIPVLTTRFCASTQGNDGPVCKNKITVVAA